MTPTSLVTLLAVGIAVCDAACFAVGAILQHDAVRRTISDPNGRSRRLDLGGMFNLVRRPRWLAGLGLIALGTSLHVVALFLAPVSVVQPIGVLGVPLAVIIAARRGHEHATPGVVIGIAIAVVGTAAFVWLAAGKATGVPLAGEKLYIAAILVSVLVAVFAIIAKLNSGWVRALGCAFGGAAAFGLVAAGMRALSQLIEGDPSRLLQPAIIGAMAIITAAAAIGGTLIQQAYTVGSPEVVLACVTVTDPFVAVLLGLMLLGEGKYMDPLTGTAMGISAVVATAGVFVLARHHPDTQERERAARKDTEIHDDEQPRGNIGPGQPMPLGHAARTERKDHNDNDHDHLKRKLDEDPAWR